MPNLQQILSYCCGQPYVDDKKYGDAVKTERRAEIRQQSLQREQLPDLFSSLRSPVSTPTVPANPNLPTLPQPVQAFLTVLGQPFKSISELLARLLGQRQGTTPKPSEVPVNPFIQPGSRLQVLLGTMMRNMLSAQEDIETDEKLENTRRHDEQAALDSENSLLGQVVAAAGTGLGGGTQGGR